MARLLYGVKVCNVLSQAGPDLVLPDWRRERNETLPCDVRDCAGHESRAPTVTHQDLEPDSEMPRRRTVLPVGLTLGAQPSRDRDPVGDVSPTTDGQSGPRGITSPEPQRYAMC
jgi:hypothetical protein